MKRIAIIIMIIILTLSLGAYGDEMEDFVSFIEKGKVVKINDEIEVEEIQGMVSKIQNISLEILSGKYKGQIIEVENYLSDNVAYEINVKDGDNVVIVVEEYKDGYIDVHISDHYRSTGVYYLLGIFVFLIILIGGIKGAKSIVTLGITIFMVIKVLLPAILKGMNPVTISVFIAIAVTIITILVIGGINSKSFAAIIGTSGGVVVAGIIAFIMGNKIKLTGLSSEEATMLMYLPQGIELDFMNLLFSGIILGALGAIMDVGMSIASSIEEIYKANMNISRKDLFKSGMNVGKDIMGTMTNTLILAYTGSSLSLLLLFLAYETSMNKIINLDIIATEIVRSLSGSIGLVITVPLTALIASLLIKRNNK